MFDRVMTVNSGVYKTRLEDWHLRSSVRGGPIRHLDASETKLPFSPALVPIMSHRLVQIRDPHIQAVILGQKLHDYLRFTSQLEQKAIVPACSMLGLQEAPINVTPQLALDGLKIAVDEAHHVYCAEDMKNQLSLATGVYPYKEHQPPFLRALRARQNSPDQRHSALTLLAFACVSETLITSSLSELPKDPMVLSAVRELVMDHARDEARHHLYFSHIMWRMWEQLPVHEKDFVGPLFVEFIKFFLSPDVMAELDWLEAAGFGQHEAKRVVEETHATTDLTTMYRHASKPTVRLMASYGMIEHSATRDALAAAGLLG